MQQLPEHIGVKEASTESGKRERAKRESRKQQLALLEEISDESIPIGNDDRKNPEELGETLNPKQALIEEMQGIPPESIKVASHNILMKLYQMIPDKNVTRTKDKVYSIRLPEGLLTGSPLLDKRQNIQKEMIRLFMNSIIPGSGITAGSLDHLVINFNLNEVELHYWVNREQTENINIKLGNLNLSDVEHYATVFDHSVFEADREEWYVNRNANIWEEIKKGTFDTEKIKRMTTVNSEIAILLRAKFMESDLDLSGLTTLSDEAAQLFARRGPGKELWLDSVEDLSLEAVQWLHRALSKRIYMRKLKTSSGNMERDKLVLDMINRGKLVVEE